MPRKGHPDDVVVTSIRLPLDDHEQFKALVAEQERTVSGQIRLLVRAYLEAQTA
jgi:predicted DNA-binding protein